MTEKAIKINMWIIKGILSFMSTLIAIIGFLVYDIWCKVDITYKNQNALEIKYVKHIVDDTLKHSTIYLSLGLKVDKDDLKPECFIKNNINP